MAKQTELRTSVTKRELLDVMDDAIRRFRRGNVNELEKAIGTYLVARHMGWKPMLLIHDKTTIRKYEKILGISFRDTLPEQGELAERSIAWKAAQKLGNFWKAVRGEVKGMRSPDIQA